MNLAKRLLAGCVLTLLLLACNSVQVSPERIPVDPGYTQGQLDNGLRYYIRHNETPANRVYLALAVKTGSLQEEEDERGLAHYLEHMAFNGSEHFPGNSLIEFARDIGMQFGAHVNAYTSFDRTVFTLNVPADDPEVVAKGLTALVDWANGLTISPEEVEKERGVVLSEYRLNQNAYVRLFRKFYRNWFSGSRYAQRIPIGLEQVVQHATAEQLRHFYRKWYHPSRMAVIAVGDVDPAVFSQQVKSAFNWKEDRPAPPKEDYPSSKHDSDDPRFFIDTEAEVGNSSSFLLIKADYQSAEYSTDYMLYTIKSRLVSSILDQRIQDSKAEGNPPFVSAYPLIPQSFHFGEESFLGINLDHKVGQFEEGFRWLIQQYQSWQAHPFTEEELELAKKRVKTGEQTYFERLDTLPSSVWRQAALADFFKENTIEDPAWTHEQINALLDRVDLQQVQQLFARWNASRDRIIQVSANDSASLPSLQQLQNIYREEMSRPSSAPVSVRTITSLFPSPPTAGQIVSEEKTDGFDGWLWQLSNGAQVYFIPSQVEQQAVIIDGWRDYGMLSLEDRPLYYNASNFNALNRNSGLAQFSSAQLDHYLSEKSASSYKILGDTRSSVRGRARSKDFETMMQLVNLQFSMPEYREQDLEKVIEERLQSNEREKKDPNAWGSNELQRILYGNDFRADPFFSAEERQALSLEGMRKVQHRYFDGAGSFTFVIAGDVQVQQVKTLVETYLASLPKGAMGKRTTKALPYRFSPGEVEKRRGNNGSAWLIMVWAWNDPPMLREKESLAWTLMSEILSIRLVQQVREAEGESYSPSSFGIFRAYPAPRLSLRISSDFAPAQKEQVIANIKQLVQDVKQGNIDEKVWKQVVEQQRRSLENVHQHLDYWPQSIGQQLDRSLPVTDLKGKQLSLLDQLTPADVVRLANRYLDDQHLLVYSFIQQEKK